MAIFDEYIKQIMDVLEGEAMLPLSSAPPWPTTEKNVFLMERETCVELGGYPKESVNLLASTDRLSSLTSLPEGAYVIGNPEQLSGPEKQISFGKIIFLDTDPIPEKELYTFTQEVLLADSKIHPENVMTRQSSTHYNINLRIGKKAIQNGLSLSRMAATQGEGLTKLLSVRRVLVIYLIGDSSLYKPLLAIAEKVKEVTLTLNHIFDGIDMDCSHCAMSPICDEVGELRNLHNKVMR